MAKQGLLRAKLRGFTLIELLVVMAALGLLLVLAVANLVSAFQALGTLMAVGLIAVAMGSYWPTLKTGSLILNSGAEIAIYSVTAIFVIFAVLGGYLLLRISVRGIGDAPNELLDERQIKVRDTSFRYAYYAMGYVVLGLLLLMLIGPDLQMFQPKGNDGSYLVVATLFAFSSMPSMVLAWRERDI